MDKSKKEFDIIESMTTIEFRSMDEDDLIVRIWRNEEELKDAYDNSDLILLAREIYYKQNGRIVALTKALGNAPRVNAVEVKNERGNGTVGYKTWP